MSSSFLASSAFLRKILGMLLSLLSPPIFEKALHLSAFPMMNSKMHSRQRRTSSQQSSLTFLLRTSNLAYSEREVRKLRLSRRSWYCSYLLRKSTNLRFSSLVLTSFWKMRMLLAFYRQLPQMPIDYPTSNTSSLYRLNIVRMARAISICLKSAAKLQATAREERVSSSCRIWSRCEGRTTWSWARLRRRGQRRSMMAVWLTQFSRLVMTCLHSMARQQMALFWIMQKASFSNPRRQHSASRSSIREGVIRMVLHSRVKMFFSMPTSSRYLQASQPELTSDTMTSSFVSLFSSSLRTRKCLLKQMSFLFSVLLVSRAISAMFLLFSVASISSMLDVRMLLCIRCCNRSCSVIAFIHLCYSNSPAVDRFSGDFQKQRRRKSMQSGEPLVGRGGCWSSTMRMRAGSGARSEQGGLPVMSSMTVQPSDQISLLVLMTSVPLAVSGAIQQGVPPAESVFWLSLTLTATPKSAILIRPSLVMRMLSPLMSRWAMLSLCRQSSPSRIWKVYNLTSASGKTERLQRVPRVPPSRYSRMRQMRWSLTTASRYLTMFLWLRFLMKPISFLMDFISSLLIGISFIATIPPVVRLIPLYTSPFAPFPIVSIIWKESIIRAFCRLFIDAL